MQLENISTLEALFGLLALIAFAALVFRIVPVGSAPGAPRPYRDDEIVAYDRALPKYLVVVLAALTLGAVHLAIRSVPVVDDWLLTGGYGAHLLRDIAYSHAMIVLGGTIGVTGLTWYVLPRILRRPLWSESLADLAFWGTVVGASGFYLANALGGGAMAALVHAGWSGDEIDYAVGFWRSLATGLFATVMGLGYWTYVINVFVTAFARTGVEGERPHRHLAKFFVVGAAGLFVGTIQGVLQVFPENVDWLHAAGEAGEYIDPISHAHVNLITGLLVVLAGVLFFVTRNTGGKGRLGDNLVFWTLVPGSVAFYLTFLVLGFREGNMIVEGGMSFSEAARAMGWLHDIPLAVSGTLTFVGLWAFLAVAVVRVWRLRPPGIVAICLGAALLGLGTLQGLVQVQPAARAWLAAAGAAEGAIANAHAQLNIVGGVLLLLLGTMLAVGAPMVSTALSRRMLRGAGIAMGAGALVYYLSALATALIAGAAIIRDGAAGADALSTAPDWVRVPAVFGALAYAIGAAVLLRVTWAATRLSRAEGWQRFKRTLQVNNTASDPWRRRVRPWKVLVPEAFGALFGFPGIGWILSGRAMVGLPLVLAGQAVAWAVIPMLISPYGDQRLPHLSVVSLEVYLVGSAVTSTLVLWIALRNYARSQPA